MEIHTAKPSLPGSSPLDVEISSAKLKSVNHQILAELIQAGSQIL
jgi:hypothetical protein